MALSADILRGYTDTIILHQLSHGDSYGYQINKTISTLSGGEVELKEATLYTAFRRLEAAGLIQSYWGSETSARAAATTPSRRWGRKSSSAIWRRGRTRNASLTSYWRDNIMCKEIFAFRRVTPFSDFSLAERLIGDTISWEEISRQRLQNANQENQEEQHYA